MCADMGRCPISSAPGPTPGGHLTTSPITPNALHPSASSTPPKNIPSTHTHARWILGGQLRRRCRRPCGGLWDGSVGFDDAGGMFAVLQVPRPLSPTCNGYCNSPVQVKLEPKDEPEAGVGWVDVLWEGVGLECRCGEGNPSCKVFRAPPTQSITSGAGAEDHAGHTEV